MLLLGLEYESLKWFIFGVDASMIRTVQHCGLKGINEMFYDTCSQRNLTFKDSCLKREPFVFLFLQNVP